MKENMKKKKYTCERCGVSSGGLVIIPRRPDELLEEWDAWLCKKCGHYTYLKYNKIIYEKEWTGWNTYPRKHFKVKK